MEFSFLFPYNHYYTVIIINNQYWFYNLIYLIPFLI